MTRLFRMLLMALVQSGIVFLLVATMPAMAGSWRELDLICPLHSGKFPTEPVIKDKHGGDVRRIHDPVERAIARQACKECGNHIFEPPSEQCDTGGASATCDADCTSVSCGDGVVNTAAGEQCDDGNEQSGDGCSATCLTEVTTGCGNGITEVGEQCDDGNSNDNDDCTNACKNPVCGDGITWNSQSGTESCDEGAIATTSCDADCTPVACGDGIVNAAAGEQCDDGNTNPGDGCEPNCTLGNLCGNLVLDPGEQCDGPDFGGQNCATSGFSGGTLACDASCSLDTSNCF